MIQEEYTNESLDTLEFFGLSGTLQVGFCAVAANLIVVFVGSSLAHFFVSQEQAHRPKCSLEESESVASA